MYLYFLYLSHLFVFIEQVLRNKISVIDLLSYYSKEGSLFYYVKLAFNQHKNNNGYNQIKKLKGR